MFLIRPSVKRVVVLSSNAAVTRMDETGRITEENWNTKNPEDVKVMGTKTPQGWKYRASKTIAERGEYHRLTKPIECLMSGSSCLGVCRG